MRFSFLILENYIILTVNLTIHLETDYSSMMIIIKIHSLWNI